MIITVFDSESDGFVEEAETIWCIATSQYVDYSVPIKLFGPDSIDEGLAELDKADVLVCHNLKKHDLPLFKKLKGWEPKSHQIILDTLTYSRMLNPKRPVPDGYTGRATHSIEAWAHRVGLHKPAIEDWSTWSEDKGVRCKEDVRINIEMLKELEREAGNLSGYYEQLRSSPSTEAGA